MANPTMALIASHITASGGESSYTFSAITANYTDLKLVFSTRQNYADDGIDVGISFNGSSSNFTYMSLRGYPAGGAQIASYTNNGGRQSVGSTATASTYSNSEIYIPNYNSSNAKYFCWDNVTENNSTAAYTHLIAGSWNPATNVPITSITLTAYSGYTFNQYSSFYLYGIRNS